MFWKMMHMLEMVVNITFLLFVIGIISFLTK